MNWAEAQAIMIEQQRNYKPHTIARYFEQAKQSFQFFKLAGHCLDMGCGDGSKRPLVIQAGASEYTGIDVHLRGAAESERLVKGSAEAMLFNDASFDSILSYSVLQHVESPDRYLSEARRVLKPGGLAAFNVCLDVNPIFMRHFNPADVFALIDKYFTIDRVQRAGTAFNRSIEIQAHAGTFEEAWGYSGMVEGWYSEAEAKQLWDCGVRTRHLGAFMEVGSYCGRSGTLLGQLKPSKLIICDPFILQNEGRESFNLFRESMVPYSYELHKCMTQELPGDFNPMLGLLHIDGDHGAGVHYDCRRLLPLLVPGGIAVFHDWAHARGIYPQIALAVDTYCKGWERVGVAESALALRKP